MKKFLNFMSVACVALMMSSCYSSTVCVGNMSKTEPSKCVNVVHNPHFLGGLVGKKEVKAKAYVGNRKDYKIKRHQSFVDGLLSSITLGIYTPTTTKFYVPLKSSKKSAKKGKAVDDDED